MKKEMQETPKPGFSLGLTTVMLAIAMLIIPLVFFFLLSQKTEASFGFMQILFSIVFAIVTTLFLVWIKSFMKGRPYLGLIIGLVALGSSEYGLFLRYKGPNTTTFVIISTLIILIYLGIHFFRLRKRNTIVKTQEEFDDSL